MLKKEYMKIYYIKNKKQIVNKSKKWNKENYCENKEDLRKYHKKWVKLNREKTIKYQRKYKTNRKQIDPIFKLKGDIRTLIGNSFGKKGFRKNSKTEKILGCTIPEFMVYLESKFQPGMTLDNHGKWHIDHKIGLVSAKTEEEVFKLCHFSNLQPLWAVENLIKSRT